MLNDLAWLAVGILFGMGGAMVMTRQIVRSEVTRIVRSELRQAGEPPLMFMDC